MTRRKEVTAMENRKIKMNTEKNKLEVGCLYESDEMMILSHTIKGGEVDRR